MRRAHALAVSALALLSSLASADDARLLHGEDTGPHPTLTAPDQQLIPTVHIASAVGWSGDAMPHAAAGLAVTAFARGLDHPRTLLVLPNGDVLVAETNAPPKPEDGKGIKGAVMKQVMKRAGAAPPSPNRLRLLRDADGDGVAEHAEVFLDGLASPFGMALVGDTLYIADSDALVKVSYRRGDSHITQTPQKVCDLPAGPINHHWTKSLVASGDGKHLYVGVGSNSNVGENGMQVEENRAAVLEVDPADGHWRVFANGLRNPAALALEPRSLTLWAAVNERDELGDDLVPDYLTEVREGAFYGWPYSYYGQHVDPRPEPKRPDLVAKAVVPDYALGAHVAPLGLAFNTAKGWPEPLRSGAFVGLHGSWNREPFNGYGVAFVPFRDGHPDGPMQDVLTGFIDADDKARGRPVGVALDARGGLLVADDVGNAVWRVAPTTADPQHTASASK